MPVTDVSTLTKSSKPRGRAALEAIKAILEEAQKGIKQNVKNKISQRPNQPIEALALNGPANCGEVSP